MSKILAGALLSALPHFVLAQTVDSVGDVDSFGRSQIILGTKQIPRIIVASTCPPNLPAGQRCTVVAPSSTSQRITHNDVLQISLPARASNSQLCLEFSGVVANYATNTNAAVQPWKNHVAAVRATVRFHSPVLADASIIVPGTNLPWPNQEIKIGYTLFNEIGGLVPNQYFNDSDEVTRRCGLGMFTKTRLVDVGLTRAQADAFFQQPIRVTVDILTDVVNMNHLSSNWQVTVFGDR